MTCLETLTTYLNPLTELVVMSKQYCMGKYKRVLFKRFALSVLRIKMLECCHDRTASDVVAVSLAVPQLEAARVKVDRTQKDAIYIKQFAFLPFLLFSYLRLPFSVPFITSSQGA